MTNKPILQLMTDVSCERGNDELANFGEARQSELDRSGAIIMVCLIATDFQRKRLFCKAAISTVVPLPRFFQTFQLMMSLRAPLQSRFYFSALKRTSMKADERRVRREGGGRKVGG